MPHNLGKLIDKGQWKGWLQFGEGSAYQKVVNAKNYDSVEYTGGYFNAYKGGKLTGFVGRFDTLKQAEEALK